MLQNITAILNKAHVFKSIARKIKYYSKYVWKYNIHLGCEDLAVLVVVVAAKGAGVKSLQ